MADDIAIVRSLHTEAINHEPAITFLQTGFMIAGKPCIGSWIAYGLGSMNEDLPTFVVLNATHSHPKANVQAISARLWSAGFMSAQYAGVALRSSGDPVLYISNPDRVAPTVRRRMLDALGEMNQIEGDYIWNWLFTDQAKHDAYDSYWKARDLSQHMKNVKCAVLVVGGWYDAEDLSGPYKTFYATSKLNPETPTTLVEGPWVHGGWARGMGDHLGDVTFNAKTGEYFRANIQFPFFEHYLKGKGAAQPKAVVFETGTNVWRSFPSWPPQAATAKTLYFHAGGKLSFDPPAEASSSDSYVSDPSHPVPFVGYTTDTVPQRYMVDDQRFASYRPDVLVYQSDILEEDVTIAGPISPKLKIASSGTDSDFDVKLIDVYPENYPDPDEGTGRPNKRILDGQSTAYGSFNNCLWASDATQDAAHPLLNLDFDNSQGSDLRPQFIDFYSNTFNGNNVAAIGVDIAASGGGAQGSNVYWWNPAVKSFTTAGIRIGTNVSYALNALALGVYGGDFQSIPGNAFANYGGGYIIFDGTTFENGYGPQQTGFDVYSEGDQGPVIARGVRSESRRFFGGNRLRIYDSAIIDQDHTWDTLGASGWPVNTYITGTNKCGNGASWQATVDSGAYSSYPFSACLEAAQVASILPGPYRMPSYRCRTFSAATNKCPILPYRGVARTGVCFALELVLDAVAARLDAYRDDVRRVSGAARGKILSRHFARAALIHKTSARPPLP